MRQNDLTLLAPCARTAFAGLDAYLRRETEFRCFETYRSPERQNFAFGAKASKAKAFESAHQFGLAADFVPFIKGQWTWDVPRDRWDVLRRAAKDFGLINEITWDRPHVEHPRWLDVRRLTR